MAKNNLCSNQVRSIIIKLVCDEGKQQKEVASLLKMPCSTISSIVSKFLNGGGIIRGTLGGARNIILTDDLKARLVALVNDDCTLTISSIIQRLGITVNPSTVGRWLKSLGITFKMTRSIPELRNNDVVKLERREYARWYSAIPINIRYNHLIFIDESPFNIHMLRSHGWSRRNTTPNPILINNRGRNVSMIVAVSCTSVVNCVAISSNVNTAIFQEFLQSLIPILGQDTEYTIIMDNVKFHHANQPFYDEYPYEVRYMPRYSPFLNPCEEVFSQIKASVRRDGRINGSNDLLQRMRISSEGVTQVHLENYFQHSESFFEACLTLSDVPRN